MKNGHLSDGAAELMWSGRTARGLGITGLVIGLAESMAPNTVARTLGAARPTVVRSFGLREIVSGLGLLAGPYRRAWLWMRVVGDALDLIALARVMGRSNPRRRAATAAFAAVALVALVDLACARSVSRRGK